MEPMSGTAPCVSRRDALLALAAGLAAPLIPSTGRAQAPSDPVPVIDLHVDLGYQTVYRGRPFSTGTGQFQAADLRQAGVVGVVLPLFIPAHVSPVGPRLSDLKKAYQRVVRELSASLVYDPPGRPRGSGRVSTWLALEGSAPLATVLSEVPTWVERGVRVFGLVHAEDNELSASATRRGGTDSGLSATGEELVRRVQQAGALVDVSHASDLAVRRVAELAVEQGSAVMATHSNARSLCDHPRNLSDPLICAIAETGGLLGINLHSRYLVSGRRAQLADVVRHIFYIAELAGIEHVALGSDFEGGILPARGLESVAHIQTLARELERAGLKPQEVEKVLSQNARHLLERGAFSAAGNDDKDRIQTRSMR